MYICKYEHRSLTYCETIITVRNVIWSAATDRWQSGLLRRFPKPIVVHRLVSSNLALSANEPNLCGGGHYTHEGSLFFRRGGRVVYCTSLENLRPFGARGFESHPLRLLLPVGHVKPTLRYRSEEATPIIRYNKMGWAYSYKGG